MTDAALIRQAQETLRRNRKALETAQRHSQQMQEAARQAQPILAQALRQLRRAGLTR